MNGYGLTYKVTRKGFKDINLYGIVIAENQQEAVKEANRNFEKIKEKEDNYEFRLVSAKQLKTSFFFIQPLEQSK